MRKEDKRRGGGEDKGELGGNFGMNHLKTIVKVVKPRDTVEGKGSTG